MGLRPDDDVDDANDHDDEKDSSSGDERSPDVKQRKHRKWPSHQFSPAIMGDGVHDDNEAAGVSPIRGGSGKMLVWGRGGARSNTRHGSRSSRVGKLLEHLRSLDDNDKEFNVHLTLLPLDGQSISCLERSHLCCRPSHSIWLLCQFISLQLPVKPEELEILVKTTRDEANETGRSNAHLIDGNISEFSKYDAIQGEDNKMQVLNVDDTLSRLLTSVGSSQRDLVLMYRSKVSA